MANKVLFFLAFLVLFQATIAQMDFEKVNNPGTKVETTVEEEGENQMCLEFNCYSSQPSIVEVYGYNYTCPDDSICNRMKKQTCQPCIKKKEACSLFTCDKKNNTKVTINKNVLYCSSGFVCNKDKESSCMPCVQEKCPPMNYECQNEHCAYIKGIGEICCDDVHICNKNNEQPCDICIRRPLPTTVSRSMLSIGFFNKTDLP